MPAGYVVVGGADPMSYMMILGSSNLVTKHDPSGDPFNVAVEPNAYETLLAKASDLEDAP